MKKNQLSPRLRRLIRRGEREITRLKRLRLPYKLGGGRWWNGLRSGTTANGPGDCSWLAMHICDVLGIHLKDPAGNTVSLAQEGEEGTSPYFTLFIKNPPGEVENEHIILRFRRRRRLFGLLPKFKWAECGGSDNPTASGGPAWFRPTEERMAEFPIQRHFPELDRLARDN